MWPVDDTIVAISSAAGAGQRAIVRLSGPASISLAQGLVASEPQLARVAGFRFVDGRLALAEHDIVLPVRAF